MTDVKQLKTPDLVKSLFKINNKPAILSEGQVEIFDSIFYQEQNRVQAITTTQYGKSETVSMATLLRSMMWSEPFWIVAPSEKKAQIIMQDVIGHCFDNEMFLSRLELDSGEDFDRLRRERSKSNITWKGGGGVRTLTVDARNGRRNLEAAMGHGGNRIVIDESSLVEDTLYATIKRMLGGFPYNDQFMFEIGNPFYRNHFYRSWVGQRYHKIFVDVKRAIAEGRLSPEFVDEMRELPLFDILYSCKFPDENEVDDNGFRQLLTTSQLDNALVDIGVRDVNKLRLGVDIGGGGDESVFVLRNNEESWVETKGKTNDTMSNVTEVDRIIDYYKVDPSDVFIDDIGIGRGVYDRLREKELMVNGVSVGDKPLTDEGKGRYFNIKAENYFAADNWIKSGGQLIKGAYWEQLLWIKYKVNSDKTIQIEPKKDLKKRIGRSPDTAEAFMLTFTEREPEPGIWVMD